MENSVDPVGVRDRRIWYQTTAVLLFSLASGATDAFAFLTFGGVFTANMTGNLILVGMFSRPAEAVALAGLAIISFVLFTYLGFKLTRTTERIGRNSVPSVLVVAVVLQAAVAGLWIVGFVPPSPATSLAFVLVGLSAAACALQTVGAKRLTFAKGTTTTYMTGTMTSLLEDVAYRRKVVGWAGRFGSVCCLVVGAIVGTATMLFAPQFGPVPPLVAGALALLCAWQSGDVADEPAMQT